MRLLLLTASLWALALARPEMYKESEDFQYSRSSSDEGTKSGFYGAQRGNMGGNYEKAHNMDSMAQHHMSTLVRQVDGELGQGANTKTGSVFTAGNSRGIYGSGNYDLSNLKGRNFGENGGYDDSQSQSSLYHNALYQGNSYATNNERYGSEQSLSSKQRSGYSSSNLVSQFSNSDLESENKYHAASNYDHGAGVGSNTRYYTLANNQARGAYDQSNTNLHSTYGFGNQERLVSATPVKVYIRPGGRVAVPISAPTYTLHSSSLQDKNVADNTNILSNSASEIAYKPTNNAKHYESSYSYHKKWEKHDTQPLVVVPTENPFPINSELYEDRDLDQTGQRYQSELDSSNTHLSNVNSGYSTNQNYQSGIVSANAQSSKTNSAYSSRVAANTKSASASQARYQSQAQNQEAIASSDAYSRDHLGSSAANVNNLVEDINSRPKSYHSSFSYHKAWERRGDPYVITPTGDVSGQTSQKLTDASQNQGQFSSQQYGSHYNQKSYSSFNCDAICRQRKKRSYNINQYEQDLNNGDINLEQQSENGWDLGQQTENKFENLEDLGQATQNTWDNLENFGQQTQNKWNNLQNLGQETQNKWNNLEDNLGQQTQNNLDHLTDLGQQAEHKWSNQADLGQQTENQNTKLENLGQETQNQFSNIEDLGQHTQEEWSKLEDLGQHTQTHRGDLGHENQNNMNTPAQEALDKFSNLGQETQNEWDGLSQQSQSQWSKLEDLGQQTQTNWGKQDFSQTHNEDLEDKTRNQNADKNKIIIHQEQKKINNVETTEPANHEFLWDQISQMFEDPPKTENSHRINNNYEIENLGNQNLKKLFEVEILPTDKQPKDDKLSPSNKTGQAISTTPKNKDSPSTESIKQSEANDLPDQQKHENTPINPYEIWQNHGIELEQHNENPWNDLGQQTQNQWSDLGQQNQNQWSDLSQQSENEWSNVGQQSENNWSNVGQQSENHWSNLGQQSENHWSNVGEQRENHWSNLGQQSENEWSNLGQQSEIQWSNLGQQSENQWSNLGQESENPWSDLGQKTQNQGSGLSQQTQNIWSHLDQQSKFIRGEQPTGPADNKAKTETTHTVEDQNLKEFFEYFQQENGFSHHSQTNKHKVQTTDTGYFHENNKNVISQGSVSTGNHNVELFTPGVDNTSSKLPNKTNEDVGTTNSETTTEVQKLSGPNNANIGRGDIGADDYFDEFSTHVINEQDKSNVILYNLPTTTRKPKINEYEKPYSHILLSPSYELPVTKPKISDNQNTDTQKLEQNIDQHQQYEKNFNLQQTEDDLTVLPAHMDYKTVAIPSQNLSIQLSRSLENVPLEKTIEQHDFTVSNHKIENLESSPKKLVEIDTPLEATTEKKGFWSSLWNKTKNAKDTVTSWFKN